MLPTEQQIISYISGQDTYAKYLEIEIIEANKIRGIALMPLKEKHRNSIGSAHGGSIFSLIDMAFAAISITDGMFWVNAQSSVSYLMPGKNGPLRAEASAVRYGKRLSTFQVNVFDFEQKLIAHAIITGCNTGVHIFA